MHTFRHTVSPFAVSFGSFFCITYPFFDTKARPESYQNNFDTTARVCVVEILAASGG